MLFVSNEGKDSCLHLNAFSRGYGVEKLLPFNFLNVKVTRFSH